MYNKRHEEHRKKGKQEEGINNLERYSCKAKGTTVLGRRIKNTDVSPRLAVRRPSKGPMRGQQKAKGAFQVVLVDY